MNLKQFAPGIWFLHLIDHATRFSASAVVTSKKREDILRGIFRIWITIFGPPSRFLSDNGGEFNNADFLEMCESLNIVVKTTAAESPWSNGLCERHNGILGEAVQRTISEVRCSVDIALAWAVHAKNALHNVHGFSPYQLVFGQNPQLPNFYINKPPALNKPSVEFIASHLAALHGARHAFLQAESSEKIKRALRHNLRSYQNVSHCSGDRVYYKRNDSNEWKGPATVLGRDGQCVLIRHGGFYVRVHPCRLMITNDKDTVEGHDFDCTRETATVDVSPVPQNLNHVSDDEESSKGSVSVPCELEPVENTPHTPASDSDVPVKPLETQISVPLKGQHIRYSLRGEDEWFEGKVHSRAGKATGKYRYCFNIQDVSSSDIRELDFQKDVSN